MNIGGSMSVSMLDIVVEYIGTKWFAIEESQPLPNQGLNFNQGYHLS